MTFSELWKRWPWRPIRNCPGRYVCPPEACSGALDELAGVHCSVREFRSGRARDPVLIAALEDGGLISYRKPDGTFLHTLNTREGFLRKLEQLGAGVERLNPASPADSGGPAHPDG